MDITIKINTDKCALCGRTFYGNGGKIQHARSHVRRGEAVEMTLWSDLGIVSRTFVPSDDAEGIQRYRDRGYEIV